MYMLNKVLKKMREEEKKKGNTEDGNSSYTSLSGGGLQNNAGFHANKGQGNGRAQNNRMNRSGTRSK